MKLSDWADKQGISYLTAYRWFKSGKLPVPAYQSDSGTIIVQDESEIPEQPMGSPQSDDVMSMVLKKTVELSKNNSSIEDFAAWILTNFSLKLNSVSETPKYSRMKPKPEEIQNHFRKFLKPKGDKPKPNMFVAEPEAIDDLLLKSDSLTTQELVEEIHKIGANEIGVNVNPLEVPEVNDLMKDISSALSTSALPSSITNYGDVAEGVVQRSVDLTPQQQLNYTSSTNFAFSNNSLTTPVVNSSIMYTSNAQSEAFPSFSAASFYPTQKEMESIAKLADKVSEIADKPKRGRKPSKNSGKK